MYFSDLPLGLRIVVFAAWLGLFLAGMAALAWVLSTGLFALPDYVILPLGGAVFGLAAGLIIGERSAIRRYAPDAWAAATPARLQARRDALARAGILVIGFGTGLIVFLVNKL